MPTVITQGAASAKGYGFGASSSVATFIEDVFSTYLYTGNSTTGGTQTITNNIDLSTKGGMVWIKGRSDAANSVLFDTTRGAGTTAANNQALSSNLSTAEDLAASYDFLSAFNTTGFTVTQGGTTTATRGTNYNAVTYGSWSFRKQSNFFDIVTYTGNGANRTISHNLGSVPGCIMVKRTDVAANWQVYHRGLANTEYIVLNSSAAKATGATRWNSTTPTSTVFSLGTDTTVNANGGTYVAYLFAHDAGGFGASGTDNVITCGSYVGAGSPTTINLGYEPQLIIWRNASSIANWRLIDNMRGFPASAINTTSIFPDDPSAEIVNAGPAININSTGLSLNQSTTYTSGATFIYIAIRRGPMKAATTASSVFGLSARTGTGANATVSDGQIADAALIKNRGTTDGDFLGARFNGRFYLETSSTAASILGGTTVVQTNPWDVMDGIKVGTTSTITNASANTYINYLFRRAPKFFDMVYYTGSGANTTQAHNLGVAPELLIVKNNAAVAAWQVYSSALANTEYLVLNTTAAKATGATRWNSTSPTSSVFSLGTATEVNNSGETYNAWLFATLAGVSKVGSYTGNGTTQQIDCGFAAGARFVLIKRTDSTGDWYYWDTARGIVSGNDPYLLLNSNAAEVTSTDYIDTYSPGFEISSTAPAAINANGGSFIFLAIA